jgi:transposase
VRATDPASKEEDGGPTHAARSRDARYPRVDTHANTHIAAALDHAGRLLGTRMILTAAAGYAALLAWASTLGSVDRVGVEGTGSYGAGLTPWLRAHGQVVVEVDRPDRAARRRQGKAADLDA